MVTTTMEQQFPKLVLELHHDRLPILELQWLYIDMVSATMEQQLPQLVLKLHHDRLSIVELQRLYIDMVPATMEFDLWSLEYDASYHGRKR